MDKKRGRSKEGGDKKTTKDATEKKATNKKTAANKCDNSDVRPGKTRDDLEINHV